MPGTRLGRVDVMLLAVWVSLCTVTKYILDSRSLLIDNKLYIVKLERGNEVLNSK